MFEIYAYGNVDTLTGVFNAIAAIMGGAGYLALIKTMAVTGVLVATVNVIAYAPLGTYAAGLAVFGSDVACCLADGTVVVIDGATATEVTRFASGGLGLAGADATRVLVAGQTAPTVVGYDATFGYAPLGGTLTGYKARVYQMSETVGRGYVSATLTL